MMVGQQRLERLLSMRGVPSREEVEMLTSQIESLSAKIDSLIEEKISKTPKINSPRTRCMINITGSITRAFVFPAIPETALIYYSDISRVAAFLLPHQSGAHLRSQPDSYAIRNGGTGCLHHPNLFGPGIERGLGR